MTESLAILIIDDNPDDREHYLRSLRKIPEVTYHCLEAPTGAQGLEVIGSTALDCVLLDYSLPGMDGMEVLKAIRNRHSSLPVILLTGQGNEMIAVEALKEGAHDYLNKSWLNSGRLHHAIGMAVKQNRIQGELAETAHQLQESNALKSAVLSSTHYMVVATDTSGLITVFNRAAELASGYAAAEVVGKRTPLLWHDSTEIEKKAADLGTQLGEPVVPGFDVFKKIAIKYIADENEWTFVCVNDARFPVHLTVTQLRDSKKKVAGYLFVLEDITKRKEIERMKNEFISIVSHELRTPLTSIRGSLGLVVGAMSKDLPAKVTQLVGIAHKNSERLILLINDILDIDKIAAGEMRFDIKREALSALMQQAVEANRAYADKFHNVIKAQPIEPDMEVDVDAERFIQVLSNLLSNAAKFSPEGSTVKLFAVPRDGKIRINVQDNGPGIPEAFHSRIFEKFSQVDSSATRAKGGSGLGLHIAKIMVEHMGGEIGFDTEPGKGTIFWVEFRTLKQTHATGVVTTKSSSGRGAYRVLICEGDKDLVGILRAQVELAGFSADTAASIADARRKIAHNDYIAMTLDLTLPSENGLSFIRELRDNAQTMYFPIVVVSAVAEGDKKTLNGDAFGVVDWLAKPVEVERLHEALQTAISALARAETMPRILHVEDDPDLTRVLATVLNEKVELVCVSSLKEARQKLSEEKFSLVVLDIELPDGDGVALLTDLHDNTGMPVPVFILSAVDVSQNLRQRVAAAMVKSRMSETKIVETILSLVHVNVKDSNS